MEGSRGGIERGLERSFPGLGGGGRGVSENKLALHVQCRGIGSRGKRGPVGLTAHAVAGGGRRKRGVLEKFRRVGRRFMFRSEETDFFKLALHIFLIFLVFLGFLLFICR